MQRAVRGWRRRHDVADPVRFAALELFGRDDRCAVHQLRGCSTRVALRHRTRDIDVFDETFTGRPSYQPPSEVKPLLSDGMRVLDLGGNIGLFGAWALKQWPKARVTSVEPDPTNVRLLRACMELNAGHWDMIEACAGTLPGSVLFEGSNYADSHVVQKASDRSITVPAIDIFPLLNACDFAKIDIEGSEWPILLDRRFTDLHPRVVVLEWHAQQAPAGRNAESLVLERFAQAGYRSAATGGPHHGVTWAWRV